LGESQGFEQRHAGFDEEADEAEDSGVVYGFDEWAEDGQSQGVAGTEASSGVGTEGVDNGGDDGGGKQWGEQEVLAYESRDVEDEFGAGGQIDVHIGEDLSESWQDDEDEHAGNGHSHGGEERGVDAGSEYFSFDAIALALDLAQAAEDGRQVSRCFAGGNHAGIDGVEDSGEGFGGGGEGAAFFDVLVQAVNESGPVGAVDLSGHGLKGGSDGCSGFEEDGHLFGEESKFFWGGVLGVRLAVSGKFFAYIIEEVILFVCGIAPCGDANGSKPFVSEVFVGMGQVIDGEGVTDDVSGGINGLVGYDHD